ncbi:MAG TPA: hypothetical protein VNL77_23700 [Roseiflexaceae bacterium]|nr:hypothetical protein [Roseiflexaceae bacterium]
MASRPTTNDKRRTTGQRLAAVQRSHPRLLIPGRRSPVAGRRSPVAGRWSPVAGRWSLVVGRWSLVVGRWSLVVGRWSLVLLAALLLSGCMLVSGGRLSEDAGVEAGNQSATFVSAEGQELRRLDTGAPGAALRVILILEAEQGELRLDVLDANGTVVLSAQSRPDEQVTRSGTVTADDQGALHIRVTARGARNGGYQVLYQRHINS